MKRAIVLRSEGTRVADAMIKTGENVRERHPGTYASCGTYPRIEDTASMGVLVEGERPWPSVRDEGDFSRAMCSQSDKHRRIQLSVPIDAG
jgi:hypothetical protein